MIFDRLAALEYLQAEKALVGALLNRPRSFRSLEISGAENYDILLLTCLDN